MGTDPNVLGGQWKLGALLGTGGFGAVYETETEDGSQAVIKLIVKDAAAARELLFENAAGPNIIPILATGEWQNYYFLVMPRAEISLRHYLEEAGGKLTIDVAIPILLDVAETLAHLEKDVVHRDLKPDNVLLYQGRWCLADFGIARYAAATTAPDTRKYAFTPEYASPEQWRYEHATPAADVYAFGVMAFEILEGQRPFKGPDPADFREQHLNQPPPPLTGFPPSLGSLVAECLYKAPQARPTPANIQARLRTSQFPPSAAASRLQAANHEIVVKQGEEGAKASAQKSIEERRAGLMDAARQAMRPIRDTLIERIREAAPSASIKKDLLLIVRLGEGTLILNGLRQAPHNALGGRFGAPPFDVVAYTTITVKKPQDRFGYEGRSHSLWFCDAHKEGVYRWFETAFMVQAMIPAQLSVNPFALDPTDEDAAGAFWNGVSVRQVAWKPLPFDQGQDEQFIERWLGWFADAVNGTLNHPSILPEPSGGRHRSR